MKLLLFCLLVEILDPVRSLDVTCDFELSNNSVCKITEPVTVKKREKVNIDSLADLNFIFELTFRAVADERHHISTVPSEIFEQLPSLETLKLHATVEVLNKGDFENASNLKHLTIENHIKIIPAGVLTSAKNLESLTLWNNQISEIEDNAFRGLNLLLRINLERNKLTIIKQNTFNGLKKLKILKLNANQIESIEENALNLPNLKKLYVNQNKLTSLPDHLFSAIPLLEFFNAQRNQINHIGKSLYGLKSLEVLSLSMNQPTDVDLVAFSQMPLLKSLALNAIGLTSKNISKIEFKEPSKSVLSALSLASNELTGNEDWKKFAIFPQLISIDVQNTKYSKIDLGDKTLRQQFPKLKIVFVSSGEWSCQWLKNFIESSEKDGIDVRTTVSSNPNGKEINDIGCV